MLISRPLRLAMRSLISLLSILSVVDLVSFVSSRHQCNDPHIFLAKIQTSFALTDAYYSCITVLLQCYYSSSSVFNLHANKVTLSLSLAPRRVTRTHRLPRIHPWPKPTHQPSLLPLPRTAFPPSSRPPILILIRTRIRTRTRPRPRTTAPSRPRSLSINSTCTSPHRATVSRTRQTPAARQSPARPQ